MKTKHTVSSIAAAGFLIVAGCSDRLAAPDAVPGARSASSYTQVCNPAVGPVTLTRLTGKPETRTFAFPANTEGTHHLTVSSEDGGHGVFTVNGTQVGTDLMLPFEIPISVAETNALTAKITGAPGTSFALTVVECVSVFVDPGFLVMESGTTVRLNQVWGSDNTGTYVVGDWGVMRKLGPTGFEPFDAGTGAVMYSITGTSDQDLFVSGQFHLMRHFDGAAWSSVPTDGYPGGFYRMWQAPDGEIFAVADYGGIYHYNAGSWTRMASGLPSTEPNFYLQGVWGTSSTNVYVAGKGGYIGHFDGSSWQSVPSPTTANLASIWGSGPDDIYIAGMNGALVHYDGTAWAVITVPTTPLPTTPRISSVWGRAANDVYAVGDAGAILHFDGKAWLPLLSPVTTDLNWVWGDAQTTFIVGANGVILIAVN
jgi:hypothetical protein